MKEFYDRKNELEYLSDKYRHLTSGELIVLYGRRRLGKTCLVKRLAGLGTYIYSFVNLGSEDDLKASFSEDIARHTGDTVKIVKWSDYFDYLYALSKKQKLILILDEFQRLKVVSPKFVTELQNQWDTRLKQNPLLVVLVGSAVGMMRRIALSPAGALYGRKTGQLKLAPFRYADFREMFPRLTEEERVTWYSVFGGTPYYLELARKHDSLEEAILKEVLEENAPLRDEPKTLLELELRNVARYNSLLHAIASGKRTIKELSDVLNVRPQTIPAYLRTLEALFSIVETRSPVLGKKKMGRHVLTDNFFRFWYRFVLPATSALESGNIGAVAGEIGRNLQAHTGMAFEEVVRELFILYNKSEIRGIPLDFTEIGRWWDKSGNEVDLIVRNRDEFLLAEIKWTNKQVDADVLDHLMEKARLVPCGGKIRFVLVSKSGFTRKCLELAAKTNTAVLDLKDITQLFDRRQPHK